VFLWNRKENQKKAVRRNKKERNERTAERGEGEE